MKIIKNLLLVVFFGLVFLNVKADEVYLKNITIDGVKIEGFSTEKTTYELTYPSEKEKITLGYEFEATLYRGKGSTGEVALKSGLNTFSFTLTSIADATKTRTYVLNITRGDSRSNDNLLSSLTVGGQKITLTDSNQYDVSVENSVKSVEVLATPKDMKATLVDGYGERTGNNAVVLNGEKTTFEIKVKAENEEVRTYTINVIKKDYKSNDATLKSLKIKEIDFKFLSGTTEYNLEVENEISKLNLEAVANHDKAKVTYDKEVTLQDGANYVLINVEAEDGTKREYRLNITRKPLVPIVANIEIEGIDFDFDSTTFNYEIETDLDSLNFNITLSKETATSEILDNENLTNGSVVRIVAREEEKTETYTFKIKNSKDIEVDDTNTSDDAKPKKTNFLKKYEMYIGLGTFGLGLFSLLVAILTRPKKSQIM